MFLKVHDGPRVCVKCPKLGIFHYTLYIPDWDIIVLCLVLQFFKKNCLPPRKKFLPSAPGPTVLQLLKRRVRPGLSFWKIVNWEERSGLKTRKKGCGCSLSLWLKMSSQLTILGATYLVARVRWHALCAATGRFNLSNLMFIIGKSLGIWEC